MSLTPVSITALASISDTLPPLGWGIIGLICIGGILLVGVGDVSRFSLYRTRAIAGVCLRESIRRRVLWLIPLTIAGAVICCQLQRASDEQDVVRQTTKFCLFATGLVVTMAAIILACTNLPREIENRVIFTVVTKPATRLELIVGKIAGFSALTGLILIIMGLFTYAYVSLKNSEMERQINFRLQNEATLGDIERQTLEHYRAAGMMTAMDYARPEDFQIYSRVPTAGSKVRGMYGGGEQEFSLPFSMDPGALFRDPGSNDNTATPDKGIGSTGLLVGVRLKWHRYGPVSARESATTRPEDADQRPAVSIDLLDASQFSLATAKLAQDTQQPQEKNAHGDTLRLPLQNQLTTDAQADSVTDIKDTLPVFAYFPPVQAKLLWNLERFYVHVTTNSSNVEYFADSDSAIVAVSPAFPRGFYAPDLRTPAALSTLTVYGDQTTPDGTPAEPIFSGRLTIRNGRTLRGGDPEKGARVPISIFRFRNIDVQNFDAGNQATMAIRVEIEREGAESDTDRDDPTQLSIAFRDPSTGVIAAPQYIKAENGLTSYLAVPADRLKSRDFEVVLRCDTTGHYLGLTQATISLVSDRQPFAFNLFKSLFITWMSTVLVISIAIFSSTFLSWPIAVVLTIVLFMGHWAVSQVADTSDKTLGRSIANDMGLTDASSSEVVAKSVNTLSSSLHLFNLVLPDTDRFAAIEDIDKGMIVSMNTLMNGLGVLIAFGLPMTVLGYIFLKKKEVAP